jgi:DNA-binding MarR family transcriptional regulator
MLMRPTTVRRARKLAAPETETRTFLDPRGLDDLVGYQLRMAYVAIRRHFEDALAHLDLTQKQTGVLWLIGANGGASQIAIATRFGMDRASMMAIVDRLEERSLVVRKRSTEDGRRQELYLTARGRKVLSQAKSAIAEHEKWLKNRFNARELNALLTALKRIYG